MKFFSLPIIFLTVAAVGGGHASPLKGSTHAPGRHRKPVMPGLQRLAQFKRKTETAAKALAKVAAGTRDTMVANQFNVDTLIGSQWANDSQTVYTINSNALVTGFKDQYWYNSAWQNLDSGSMTYDSSGRQLTLNGVIWDSLAQWDKYLRYTYTYPNDTLQTFLQEDWIDANTGWVNDELDTDIVDVKQNPVLTMVQYWTDSAWLNSDLYTTLYNAQELPLRYVYEYWYQPAHQWVLDTKDTLIYNGSGLLTNQTELALDSNGDMTNYTNVLFTYATGSNPTEVRTQYWDGSEWEDDHQEDYAYDAKGNDTTYEYLGWDGSQWDNVGKTVSTYDSSGDVLQSVQMNWNGGNGTWVGYERGSWIYAQFNVGVLPFLSSRPQGLRVQAAGGDFILTGLAGVSEVQIRDFSGRQMALVPVRNGMASWRPTHSGPALAVCKGKGVFFTVGLGE